MSLPNCPSCGHKIIGADCGWCGYKMSVYQSRPTFDITYQRWKSMITAQYGKDIANKHCVHEGWTQKQCMDFIRDKLGNNHKLVKTLEQNYGH